MQLTEKTSLRSVFSPRLGKSRSAIFPLRLGKSLRKIRCGNGTMLISAVFLVTVGVEYA